MTATTASTDALVDPAELRDIELVVLRRMKERNAGAHPSVFHGDGFDFVGHRDWQPGDRPSAIDWAQSTITNFSPLITREFEQESSATVMILADASASTRCGAGDWVIARVIARAVATLGFAAAFFQDQVGLTTVDGRHPRRSLRPKVGRAQALHCVEAYDADVRGEADPTRGAERPNMVSSVLRRTSFVPVVSDFLFDDARVFLDELHELSATHDILLVMVEGGFAFEVPTPADGWIEVRDAESGQTALLSAGELGRLGERAREWQQDVARWASERGLDLVTLVADEEHTALANYFAGRRRQKR